MKICILKGAATTITILLIITSGKLNIVTILIIVV